MLTFASAIVRAWTWLYTSGLDPDPRDDRRAQIESDLWDYKDDATEQGVHDAAMAAHVLARLLLGMPDDLLWRREQLSVVAHVVALSLGESHAQRVVFRRASGFGVSATVHALLVMLAVWLGPELTTVAFHNTSSATGSTTIVFMPPPDMIAPPPRDAAADVVPEDNLGILLGDSGSTVALPGFTFDFSKVVKRAGGLFPFVTGTMALDRIAAVSRLPQPSKGLINPLSRTSGAGSGLPPLQMNGAEMQALVDHAWARRDRWKAFAALVPIAEGHDPNTGELPALMRAYVEQNGLQPYVQSDVHDPRLWTQLGVVSDHAAFIDFISRYLARHTSTKTATELLFLLDTLVQGSNDTLTALLDAIPETDLGWTRSSNPGAYEAIVTIQQHYQSELERHNLTTRTSLRLYFDEARISILTNLIETTPNGYRANDARFLIGSIYWKQGRLTEAVTAWSQLRADATDRYAAATVDLLDALSTRTMKDEDILRIGRILDTERGRWISFSHDRLKQFGYRFNVF